MNDVSLFAAFGAGIAIFFTPCVLPLIPVYLGYMGRVSAKENKRLSTFLNALLFVVGFSLVFIMLGASVGLIGFFIADKLPLIRKIVAIFLIIFGLHLLGVLKISWFYRERRPFYFSGIKVNYLSSFLLGISFSFAWTPCVGPILGGILTLAYDSAMVLRGTLLLSVFSLGLAVPFIASSLLLDRFMGFFKAIKRYSRWVEFVSGSFLIILGVLVFTDNLIRLNNFFNFVDFGNGWI